MTPAKPTTDVAPEVEATSGSGGTTYTGGRFSLDIGKYTVGYIR